MKLLGWPLLVVCGIPLCVQSVQRDCSINVLRSLLRAGSCAAGLYQLFRDSTLQDIRLSPEAMLMYQKFPTTCGMIGIWMHHVNQMQCKSRPASRLYPEWDPFCIYRDIGSLMSALSFNGCMTVGSFSVRNSLLAVMMRATGGVVALGIPIWQVAQGWRSTRSTFQTESDDDGQMIDDGVDLP